jgi:hypothetical protein
MYENHIETVAGFVVGAIGTGVVLARTWWTGKTKEQKKEFVKDTLAALADRNITIDEASAMIDEHF